jgi:hypothetical protein
LAACCAERLHEMQIAKIKTDKLLNVRIWSFHVVD